MNCEKILIYNFFFLNPLDLVMRGTLIDRKLADTKVENSCTSRFKRDVLWKTPKKLNRMKSNKSLKCNVLENHATQDIGVE